MLIFFKTKDTQIFIMSSGALYNQNIIRIIHSLYSIETITINMNIQQS